MRLAQLHRPLQAAASGCYRPALSYSLALRPAPIPTPLAKSIDGRRYASVKSQGAYKLRPRKTIPKKLGAKRSGDQYVIPGNIIYKQRGTVWHPGENAILGRDHTIHAAVAGYVKYYRDPARHPTRQYIGVAFERDDKLPYPRHAVRKRKLGMVAVPRREGVPPELMSRSGIPRRVVRTAEFYDLPSVTPEQSAEAPEAATESKTANTATSSSSSKKAKAKAPHHLTFIAQRWQERRRTRVLHLNRDYSYSEGNAAIGRLAGRTMYVAPWKLGSRKARFRRRARREKHEARMKADAERRRLAVLAEVRGTGKPKAAKGSGGGGNDKKSKGKGKKAAA